MRFAMATAALGLALGCAVPATAQVIGAGMSGFQVQETLRIAAPPQRVWDTILKPGGWWNSEHSYSHDSNNMTIAPVAGGCWCEKWAGGSVEHMRVVLVSAPKTLRMLGTLGPLQEMGATGSMTWSLTPTIDGAGTVVTLNYAVGGYSPDNGFGRLAVAVDGVLAEQLNRLQMYIQTGNPVAVATH